MTEGKSSDFRFLRRSARVFQSLEDCAPFVIVFVPVAVILAGGRAFSRLHVGYFYFYDGILATAFFLALFLAWRRRRGLSRSLRNPRVVLLISLPLWAVFRLLTSEISLETLREFHPFLMLSYGALVAVAMGFLSPRKFELGVKFLQFGLVFHALLLGLRIGLEYFNRAHPTSLLYLDALKVVGDADGWPLGVLAGILIFGVRGKRKSLVVVGAVLVGTIAFVVGILGSRSTAVALIVIFVLMIIVTLLQKPKFSDREVSAPGLFLLALTMAFSIGVVSSLVATDLGSKFKGAGGSIGLISAPDGPIETGDSRYSAADRAVEEISVRPLAVLSVPVNQDPATVGFLTASARLDSWQQVILWTIDTPDRFLFGSGFGSGYYFESGAREALVGDGGYAEGENSWPHNFILTIFGLFGGVGLFIFLVSLGWALSRLGRSHVRCRQPVDTFAMLIIIAISIVSFFGVVFENPFGSVPFAWSIGIALAKRESSGIISRVGPEPFVEPKNMICREGYSFPRTLEVQEREPFVQHKPFWLGND